MGCGFQALRRATSRDDEEGGRSRGKEELKGFQRL